MSTETDILILDLATTGTNPNKDEVLEVAYILTQSPGFPILEAETFVVAHPDGIDQKCPKFHAQLVKEATDPDGEAIPRQQVEAALNALPKVQVIANRALDFDLGFLEVHFPSFYKTLRYASKLDIKGLGQVLGPIAGGGPEQPERTHRAGDEAGFAYDELVHFGDKVEEAFR